MALFTKSMFRPIDLLDGTRISVMNRHTLNDGITPDGRITSRSYDEHLKKVSPPAELLGDYYKRGLPFEEYLRRYLEYLRQDGATEVKSLALRATKEDITLLCIEDSAEDCHRKILAEECQRYEPRLKVVHL